MQVYPSYVLCTFIQEVGEVCEAIASSLQSCMKTQIVVSVEGFQVLGHFLLKFLRVHDW